MAGKLPATFLYPSSGHSFYFPLSNKKNLLRPNSVYPRKPVKLFSDKRSENTYLNLNYEQKTCLHRHGTSLCSCEKLIQVPKGGIFLRKLFSTRRKTGLWIGAYIPHTISSPTLKVSQANYCFK